jgi:hypothetical protein
MGTLPYTGVTFPGVDFTTNNDRRVKPLLAAACSQSCYWLLSCRGCLLPQRFRTPALTPTGHQSDEKSDSLTHVLPDIQHLLDESPWNRLPAAVRLSAVATIAKKSID